MDQDIAALPTDAQSATHALNKLPTLMHTLNMASPTFDPLPTFSHFVPPLDRTSVGGWQVLPSSPCPLTDGWFRRNV